MAECPLPKVSCGVRINSMDDRALDQNEETILICEIPDEALESGAWTGKERVNSFTQWVCTALYFCPGP
jgi:hypothetical protein